MVMEQLPYLSTSRIDLLPMTEKDVDLYFKLFSNPQVMAHLGGTVERVNIEGRHRKAMDHWKQHGFGTGVICLRETGEKIGIASLFWTEVEGEKVLERGVAILPAHQGKGIWKEVSVALVDFARTNIEAPAITAFPSVSNERSNSILAKTGFKRMGIVEYPYLGKVLRSVYWRLDFPPRK
jgi:RimJ/RimL family protein N-acetyltransferase